ncbi:dihydrodipicolinate reductase [Palleronia sp. KMU-117]|uniref:dihydrodipicolinate reductase n=1 Tax=Palleronia sp. KMU-117 TaxID=3434108 RepID=UPI003D75D60A
MMRIVLTSFVLSLMFATTAPAAQEFQTVREQDRFVNLVSGRELTRFGIKLTVTPDGEIRGRAFGRPVSGNWQWSDGYFCRTLFYGDRDLGPNCQEVKVQGETIRFTSDRGQGIYADLTLE